MSVFSKLPLGAPLVAMLLLFGCNTGSGDDADDGAGATACGLAGVSSGTECTGLEGCGAGASNSKTTSFCEHCLLRPDTHVCEAGLCRRLGGTGFVQTQFGIPVEAEGAKSFTVATLHPIMADGSKVTCAKLTSTCTFLDNSAINTTNSTFKLFSPEPARSDSVYPSLLSAEAGAGRILFIQITTDTQGKGAVVAQGCAEGISVEDGQTVTVPIEIKAI